LLKNRHHRVKNKNKKMNSKSKKRIVNVVVMPLARITLVMMIQMICHIVPVKKQRINVNLIKGLRWSITPQNVNNSNKNK
jgi:hypothetical protein